MCKKEISVQSSVKEIERVESSVVLEYLERGQCFPDFFRERKLDRVRFFMDIC